MHSIDLVFLIGKTVNFGIKLPMGGDANIHHIFSPPFSLLHQGFTLSAWLLRLREPAWTVNIPETVKGLARVKPEPGLPASLRLGNPCG